MRAATAFAVVSLGSYLFVLVRRTEWLTRSTSIGMDVIVGYHLIGIGAILLAMLLSRSPERRFVTVLSWSAWLVEIAFLAMNLSGKVWEYRKDGAGSLAEAIVSLVRGVWK